MTKKPLILLLLAALTVSLLAGCGNDTTMESSVPEGLATFGVEINPSASPSVGQTVSGTGDAVIQNPVGNGTVDENNTQGNGTPGNSSTSSPTSTPSGGGTSSSSPSTSRAPSSPSTSSDPTDPPIISPPLPASNATADEAREYIGKTRDELIDALGLPTSSDYELIDEDDPDAGEIGTLYFKGFTVSTKKTAEGEIITSVNVDEVDPEPDPE